MTRMSLSIQLGFRIYLGARTVPRLVGIVQDSLVQLSFLVRAEAPAPNLPAANLP